MSATLALLKSFIARPSLTPEDAGCQTFIAARLAKLGFNIEHLPFGHVKNLWARRGTTAPLIVFAGHTDVVPTGPLDEWHSDPFTPTERDGNLYGRGATDMKSGLAAMIVAAENFVHAHPHHTGSIGFLITSDEEGSGSDGTVKVIETLVKRNEKIDYCIVGEASSDQHVGDTIRIGRRGSLHGTLTVYGQQGHVAFPEKVRNPIHLSAAALAELANTQWDLGNAFFPPTTFQISNLHAGTGAPNVVPGTLDVLFNFRFGTASTIAQLQQQTKAILTKHQLDYNLAWHCNAYPFLTEQGKLIQVVENVIRDVTGRITQRSTAGGTSDARFIAPTGAEVVEIGPCNASAHKINEHIRIADLDILQEIYQRVLKEML